MKVLDSRIVVQVSNDLAPQTKIGDFVVTDSGSGHDYAKVIAIGPDAKGIEVGETVIVYKNAGHEFDVDGVKYKTVTSSEIVVIL